MHLTMMAQQRRWILGVFSMALVGALTGQAVAQDSSEGITTTGTSTIVVSPSKLRLTLTMEAKADDAKKALKMLQEHKTRVKGDLVALKAEEASIRFGSTRLEQNDGFPANYPQPSVRARILQQASNRGVDPEDLPVVYIAKAELKADWVLPTADADAIALLISSLREQVIEKDLLGKKNEGDVSDEVREKMESLQQLAMQQGYYVDNSAGGEGLSILLVGTPTDEQRTAAIKEAFTEAIAKAEQIAAATGCKLSKPRSIRESMVASAPVTQTTVNQYGQTVQTNVSPPQGDKGAILSADVDGLKKVITVTVVHGIE